MSKVLYIFLDEAGNLTFSKKGTDYFILSALVVERPFPCYNKLINLRYDLVEYGFNIESFHASSDSPPVRDRVFKEIKSKLNSIRIDSLVIEKRKTLPALQKEINFYPEMVGYLIRYILRGVNLKNYDEIIVFTDTIPLQKKRRAIEGETKIVIRDCIPKGLNIKFQVIHHSSKSNICLQIVDYCCWAIFRKWERNDNQPYNIIKPSINSEFEIFKGGKFLYY